MSDLARKSQFLIYQAEGGAIKIDVRFEDETVWLTQQLLAELFQTSKQNIGQHLKNVFAEGELTQKAVVKNFFTTAADGKNFLRLNERGILTHAGKLSHELALGHAEHEYDGFHLRRIAENAEQPDDFEKSIKSLPTSKPRAKKKKGTK